VRLDDAGDDTRRKGYRDTPELPCARKILHAAEELDRETFQAAERVEQHRCQCTVVNIRLVRILVSATASAGSRPSVTSGS